VHILPSGTDMGTEASGELAPGHTAPRAHWFCRCTLRSEVFDAITSLINCDYIQTIEPVTFSMLNNYFTIGRIHTEP
jgi:hypothetical protein